MTSTHWFRGLALAAAILAVSTATPAASMATGRVFLDANGNGELDDGEQGVAGVPVSNGRDVVVTDDRGHYELPVRGPTIIRLTKPRGYAVPTSASHAPRFYYIHDPEGSPGHLRYGGVAPTGPLPERINFPLRRAEPLQAFDAILMADPQPQSDRELDFVRDDVISELMGTDAAFGLTVGDLMYDDLALWPRYKGLVGQVGIPWWQAPGNHDVNRWAMGDEHALETYKRFHGPTYYSFNYGAAHFVVLNNVYYEGREAGGTRRRITDRQLTWLRNDLAHVPEDRLVVVAMHIPLESDPADASQNQRELFDALEGYAHAHVIAAHRHATKHVYFGAEDGFDGEAALHQQVLGAVSGSWWSGPKDAQGIPDAVQRDGTPNGYYILDVDGTDAEVRFRAARRPRDYQMRVLFDGAYHSSSKGIQRDYQPGQLFDGRLSRPRAEAAEILVNLFNGGPGSSVAFRVDGGRYRAMERVEAVDPYVETLYQRHAETIKPVAAATPSSHLWRAPLPDDLAPGTHSVSVRATDAYGRTYHAERVLEISGR